MAESQNVLSLAAAVQAADKRAIARAISMVEDGAPEGEHILRQLYASTGRAFVLGVTGAPGAGKSTLADALVARFRSKEETVGVIAVDPTSAFTGGAILGDRIRMQKHASDNGVFVRSMATRGEMGGLARATMDAVDILDAANYGVVLVETVGVGQDEIEIAHAAHAVVLVLTPEMGDDIQALKAGVMEIADFFVVNKADRPGADRFESRLQAMLALDSSSPRPKPRTFQTVASEGKGMDALFEALQEMMAKRENTDEAALKRARHRGAFRLLSTLRARLLERAGHAVSKTEFQVMVETLMTRTLDPYAASDEIMKRMGILTKKKNS